MSTTALRILWAILIFLNAGLAFFLAGGQAAGVPPLVMLLLGALAAGIGAVLGLPTLFGLSTVEPGKREVTVLRTALRGETPRGMS